MLSYTTDAPRIPAAAIATEDADRIARLVAAGHTVKVKLSMGATFAPDVASANVVAEIPGTGNPEEVVLLAAHLDSWDVGQGAQDDGGGCMAVMEALRAIAASGVKPRRTIRGVLFVNEENGLRGAMAYAREHADEARRHVAAIEADSGTYAPLGFTSPAPKAGDAKQTAVRARLASFAALLAPTGATRVKDGGGGADIGPLEPAGVPQIGLMVEGSRYFDVHHTHADTFDRVSKPDLDACASALAVLAFAISELPGRLDAPLPAPAVSAPGPR
jgi:Zn-dependent M28 family amino/carboxypeptidase